MGLAIGMVAGVAAGLLAAPMRGADMRATLRERASDGGARLQSLAGSGRGWMQQTLDRAMLLLDEGRRAFDTGRSANTTRTNRPAPMTKPVALTATLGEIAQFHGTNLASLEAQR